MSNASLSSFSVLPASHVGKPPYHRTSSKLDLRYQTFFTNYTLILISHTFSAPSSSNTEPFSGSSNDTSESYGTQSAGYDNNIERTGGEESGSKGGVKGALGKIKDKLAPSGQGQTTKVDENEAVKNSFGGAGADAGKEMRSAQANTDLNRE